MNLRTSAVAALGIVVLGLPVRAEFRRGRASDLAKTVTLSANEARDSFAFASSGSKAHLEAMRLERNLRRDNPELAALGQYQYTATDRTYAGVNAWNIWVRGPHEVHHRITQGALQHAQRVLVRVEPGAPVTIPVHENYTAVEATAGESTAWTSSGPRADETTYWVVGQARGDDHWRLDTGVHVKRDVYTRGVLYTLTYADTFGELSAASKVARFAILWQDDRNRQLYVNP